MHTHRQHETFSSETEKKNLRYTFLLVVHVNMSIIPRVSGILRCTVNEPEPVALPPTRAGMECLDAFIPFTVLRPHTHQNRLYRVLVIGCTSSHSSLSSHLHMYMCLLCTSLHHCRFDRLLNKRYVEGGCLTNKSTLFWTKKARVLSLVHIGGNNINAHGMLYVLPALRASLTESCEKKDRATA